MVSNERKGLRYGRYLRYLLTCKLLAWNSTTTARAGPKKFYGSLLIPWAQYDRPEGPVGTYTRPSYIHTYAEGPVRGCKRRTQLGKDFNGAVPIRILTVHIAATVSNERKVAGYGGTYLHTIIYDDAMHRGCNEQSVS